MWKCNNAIYMNSRGYKQRCVMETFKLVMVGDGLVGKTSLLHTWMTGTEPEYCATWCDNHSTTVTFGGRQYALDIVDTGGDDCHDRHRPRSYPGTDAFIVIFSVAYTWLLDNVKEKWIPEIRRHCPNIPFVLVGNKTDERDSSTCLEKLAKENLKPISTKQGEKLANELGAAKYVECSARKKTGLKQVFDEAIRAAISAKDYSKRPSNYKVHNK